MGMKSTTHILDKMESQVEKSLVFKYSNAYLCSISIKINTSDNVIILLLINYVLN